MKLYFQKLNLFGISLDYFSHYLNNFRALHFYRLVCSVFLQSSSLFDRSI